MNDWVRTYKIVRWHGKVVCVYEHSLHIGLLALGHTWLSWSAEPVC